MLLVTTHNSHPRKQPVVFPFTFIEPHPATLISVSAALSLRDQTVLRCLPVHLPDFVDIITPSYEDMAGLELTRVARYNAYVETVYSREDDYSSHTNRT